MPVPTEIRCTACGRATTTADRYCGFCGARLDAENATPTAETTGPHRPHVDRIQTALRAGTIGEYDIAGEIGRGGMAVVFLAHDLSLNRKVAIKALLPELLYTEGMDRRFKHEARIAAKLDHPNILVIHSVREANELLFIVMKLVEGLPLSAIAKVAGPLPISVVRLVVRHVAEALSYAHGEGVVHRDVKPANIMVDRRGNVVVMDFGIAKAADDAHLTRTGLVIGTPAYMSPEQCLAQGVAPASDQYSLGVVAYELLTGRTPFRGSALEMQWAHATAAPPTVRSLRPDCPPELEALVLRMLAKAPADRWPTLHDVFHELADDVATVNAARATLVRLVNEAPTHRDPAMPTTPASPVPIGPGPMAAGEATTDPVRRTRDGADRDDSDAPNAAPVAGPILTLSRQHIELTAGDSVELIVELEADDRPSDGSAVVWRSSNASVAEVSADGFVTAKAPGLAEIGCEWRGRHAMCVVHVTPAAAAEPITAPLDGPLARDLAMAAAAASAAAEPPAPAPPRWPEVVPRATPVASMSVSGPRKRWWVGVLAAGVVGVTLYRGMQPSGAPATSTAVPQSVSSAEAPASPAALPVVDSSVATASASAGANSSATVARPNATPPGAPVPPAGTATAPPPGPRPPRAAAPSPDPRTATDSRTPASQRTLPPPVPLARPDTTRRTFVRTDSGTASGASRAAAPASATTGSPAAPASGKTSSATPAPRDSSADVIPVPTRDIATALFREFANVINSRTYTRITAAYSQPSDAGDVKLWQDFLVFVRDYTPRATVRSVGVDSTTSPPTISATIDFRWSTDAGFERVRPATFVGVGLPATTGGWTLHRARLTKKFW
jgi:serine/threonine-protein kinase